MEKRYGFKLKDLVMRQINISFPPMKLFNRVRFVILIIAIPVFSKSKNWGK